MGFLSGGFLGSGADESSTSTHTETHVTTETNTTLRDIGLTGQGAVDLVNVATGNLGQVYIQGIGQNYNQLIGGANNLIQTGAALVSDISDKATLQSMDLFDRGVQFLSDLGARQSDQAAQLLTVQADATNPALSLAKGSQNVILAIIAAIALIFISKGGFR